MTYIFVKAVAMTVWELGFYYVIFKPVWKSINAPSQSGS